MRKSRVSGDESMKRDLNDIQWNIEPVLLLTLSVLGDLYGLYCAFYVSVTLILAKISNVENVDSQQPFVSCELNRRRRKPAKCCSHFVFSRTCLVFTGLRTFLDFTEEDQHQVKILHDFCHKVRTFLLTNLTIFTLFFLLPPYSEFSETIKSTRHMWH